MPTYQYQCTECGEALEAQQSFSDDALTECPVCGGRLRKVFNAVGVVFKGSGFYRNDSRSTTTSSDAPSSEPSKKNAEKTATTKESSTNGASGSSSPASTPATSGG